jgi:hypothetical protein
MRSSVVVALLCLVLSVGAWGSDKVIEKRVTADTQDTPEKFEQLIEELHQEMGPGGRYEFIKADSKTQVEADLSAMQALLKKSGSVAKMSKQDQVELFNHQEHLNGILVHNDGNRLICEHKPPMGSNIPVTMCKTVAELEKQRRDAQKMMQDADKRGWGPTHGQ